MRKLVTIVTLVLGTSLILWAQNPVSVSQWNTTAVDTNSGNKSAGTVRVVLATDQPQLTNKLLVTPDANSAVNVAQVGGTNVLTGNGVTGAGSMRVTIASDNTAFAVSPIGPIAHDSPATGISPLLVGGYASAAAPTDVSNDGDAVRSWFLRSGAIVNQPSYGGNLANTGTGTAGTGTPRVAVASDSTLTSVGSITNTVTAQGTLTNNNAAPSTNNFGALVARATASAPTYTEGNMVALSTDNAGALRVSGAAGGGVAQTQVRNSSNSWNDVGYSSGNLQMPVQDAYLMQLLQQLIAIQKSAGYVKGTFGRPVTSTADALNVYQINPGDPCQGANKGNAAISQTATSRLVVGMEGKRIFVCYARFVAAVAEIVSFTEGTGSNCGTGTKAVSGSTTAANGESYAANGGTSAGNGIGTIAVTANPGSDLCLAQSGAQRVSGNITFVYQ